MRWIAVLGATIALVACGTSVSQWTGTYVGTAPAADSPGRTMTLTLADAGKLTFSTDYQNNRPPVVEVGTWTATNGRLRVTLTGLTDRSYTKDVVIEFEASGARLTAVTYDRSLYGSAGLTLNKR